MVIVMLDEPGLFVYADADAAVLDIEAIDIEDSLRVAYDDEGYRLDVQWIEPNERGKSLWLSSVSNGKCRLARSQTFEPLALADLLSAAPYFIPEGRTAAMRELAINLRTKHGR